MTALDTILEDIYASLKNDNHDLDTHIAALSKAMKENDLKVATFDPAKLAQPNRQGRKMMQSYFQKRGVTVDFA